MSWLKRRKRKREKEEDQLSGMRQGVRLSGSCVDAGGRHFFELRCVLSGSAVNTNPLKSFHLDYSLRIS